MRDKPKEVQLGLFADENGDVRFSTSDERFFNTLFTGPCDGIAVDVIPRSQMRSAAMGLLHSAIRW